MPTRNLSIRLSVRDADVVRRSLEGLGKEGQAALRRIERSAQPASRSLLALNAASRTAQGSIQGMATRLGPVGAGLSALGPGGLAAAGGLAAVVAAGAGLTKLALDAAQVGDQFQKMALRTNVSVETLSELAHAAELSGTSITAIEPSLVRLQRRMVAAQGTNNLYARGFEYLGIVTEDANGKLRDVEDVFFDIADAVEAAGGSTETVNAVTRVLGQTASSLIPLLQGGAEGMRDMMREARALGLSITQEQADRAARMNDEISKLGAAWRGLKQDIGFGLIGPLTEAIEDMQDLIGWFNRMTEANIRGGIRIREFFGIGLTAGQQEFLRQQEAAIAATFEAHGPPAPQERRARPPLAAGQIEGVEVAAERFYDAAIENILQPLERTEAEMNDFGRNLEIEIELTKRRNQLAAQHWPLAEQQQQAQLQLTQQEERLRLRNAGASEEQIAALGKIHQQELELLRTRQDEEAQAEKNRIALQKLVMQRIQELQNIQGLIGLIGQLNDNFGQMAQGVFNLFQAIPQGPFATFIAGTNLLIQAFNRGQRDIDEYSNGIQQLNRVFIQAARDAQGTVETLLAESPDYLEAQRSVLAPLQTFFFQFQAATPNLRNFEQIREFLLSFSEISQTPLGQFLDPPAVSGFPPYARVPQEFLRLLESYVDFLDPLDYFRELQAVFGTETLFGDVLRESFQLEKAFESLTNTVIDTTSAEERAVRARFDLEEMGLRQAARRQYILAGGDPFLQAGVFRGLSRQIGQLAEAERAALRTIGGREVIPVGGGGAGAGGGGTGGTGGTGGIGGIPAGGFAPIMPQTWAEVIDISLLWQSENAITAFNWTDAIKIGDKYGVDGLRPQSWEDVISKAQLWRMSPFTQFHWTDVIKIGDKYGVNGRRPQSWEDVIARSTLWAMPPFVVPWEQAIDMQPMMIGDWGQIIPFTTMLDLAPYIVPWERALVMQPIRIESWSQVFESQDPGGHGAGGRAGGSIFPPPITIQATELVRIVGRIPISAIVDTSELDARIDGRITRSRQDRTQTEEEAVRGLYDLVGKRT